VHGEANISRDLLALALIAYVDVVQVIEFSLLTHAERRSNMPVNGLMTSRSTTDDQVFIGNNSLFQNTESSIINQYELQNIRLRMCTGDRWCWRTGESNGVIRNQG